MYEPGYRWINHSIKPSRAVEDPAKNMRVEVGEGAVRQALLRFVAEHFRDELRGAEPKRDPRAQCRSQNGRRLHPRPEALPGPGRRAQGQRAYRFHRHTLESLAEFTSAAGPRSPTGLSAASHLGTHQPHRGEELRRDLRVGGAGAVDRGQGWRVHAAPLGAGGCAVVSGWGVREWQPRRSCLPLRNG